MNNDSSDIEIKKLIASAQMPTPTTFWNTVKSSVIRETK